MEQFENLEGIGSAIAKRIREELGIEDLESLDDTRRIGRLRQIRGVGSHRIKSIARGLTEWRGKRHRTKSHLKDKRHWTKSGIAKFLGEPDETKKNPHYSSAAEMQLYDMTRVRLVEATAEFQEWLEQSLPRQKAAKDAASRGAKTRRKRTLERVEEMKIEIEDAVPKSVRKSAVREFNRNDVEDGPRSHPASLHSEKEFLDRITVNHVRHRRTRVDNRPYDAAISDLEGRVGKSAAYYRLKRRVLEEIANVYPALADECERQAATLRT